MDRTRRTLLRTGLLGALGVGALGLAACGAASTGGGAPSSAASAGNASGAPKPAGVATASTPAVPAAATAVAKPAQIRVAYMPIIPSAHAMIADAKGWYKELGTPVEMVRFESGPPIVQAFAGKQVDLAYFGIAPAYNAVAKGIGGKVVAGSIVEQVALLASNQFDAIYQADKSKNAFATFAAKAGHKLKIATLPVGSVPDTMLKLWLTKLGADPENDVEVLGMGEDRVRQALLAQQVDAALILEPVISIVKAAGLPYTVTVKGSEILPGQPGAILFVTQELVDKYLPTVQQLVDIQLRATKLLKESKDEAAKILSDEIGPEALPVDLARAALNSPATNWQANPHKIVDATKTLNEFDVKAGTTPRVVPTDELFDFRAYDAVVKAQPALAAY